jgi:hypothetical protein
MSHGTMLQHFAYFKCVVVVVVIIIIFVVTIIIGLIIIIIFVVVLIVEKILFAVTAFTVANESSQSVDIPIANNLIPCNLK